MPEEKMSPEVFFVALKRKVSAKFSSQTLFDFGAKSHDVDFNVHSSAGSVYDIYLYDQ